ncbi:MAG: universal stress protein [Candidatus Thorarchaeota archaeon]
MYPGIAYFQHPVFIAKGLSYEKKHHYKEEIENKGWNILNRKKEMFETANIPVKIRLIEDEDPDEYILRVIKEENFDLVVIGNRGIHSKLREILIGSVAENVIINSSCDVLVIK